MILKIRRGTRRLAPNSIPETTQTERRSTFRRALVTVGQACAVWPHRLSTSAFKSTTNPLRHGPIMPAGMRRHVDPIFWRLAMFRRLIAPADAALIVILA